MRRKRNQPWGVFSAGPSLSSYPRLLSCFCHPYLQPQWTISSASGLLQCSQQHIKWINSATVAAHWRSRSCSSGSVSPPPPFGHLKTCPHPAVLLHNLTLSFSGDFPQRYECGRLVCACVRVRRRACQRVWPNVWVRLCPLCLFIYLFVCW